MVKKGEEVPKGHVTIKVGGEGEVKERIVVPVMQLNHPLFGQLLKEAEKEYGFSQEGAIIIPCPLNHFRYVQALILRDTSLHNHHLPAACFRLRF
ncbi:auxin-responsive protein SAUR32-like [Prosopis cineraria]|uniref:auxin-responsive protein SAUR32-like n=1 Tax=Prosopis cineraria TaxID=364024 RepID=UPI00240F789E|nr:auxin-responsive protein SAUR32-like [Prosopis cineraria]